MNERKAPERSKGRKPARYRRAGYAAGRVALWSLSLVLLGLFANKVWHPIGLNHSLQADVAGTRREVEAMKQDNAVQRRRLKYLQTPDGIQAQARKLGYINKGEIPLRIQDPSASQTPDSSKR